jgi:tryptophan-rich sensory protein
MLMWAFFHATCDDQATNDMRNMHRGIFLVIILLAILDFALFFLIHNVSAALVANVFALALVIGTIVMFTTLRDDDSWFAFPMLLWLCYRIHTLVSILVLNPHHPDMNNYGITL